MFLPFRDVIGNSKGALRRGVGGKRDYTLLAMYKKGCKG
jgi:hypothetical protein